MPRLTRTPLALALTPALLLAACLDRELPTALAPNTPAFATLEVGCGAGRVAELIAAVNAANGDQQPDVIRLAPGCTYTLTDWDNNPSNGPNGLPVITSPITIEGNGARIERSLDAPGFRILMIGGGAVVRISGLTIANGDMGYGGGIYNNGTLTLEHSSVSGNRAGATGGGILNDVGTLTLEHSTVSDNSAGSYGGGVYNSDGTVMFIASAVSGNHAGYGGGIGSYTRWPGVVTLLNSTVSGNSASIEGGGVSIDRGPAQMVHSTITGNRAASGGGVFSAFTVAETHMRASLIWGNTLSDGTSANDIAAAVNFSRYTSLGHNLIGAAGDNVDFDVDFKAPGDLTNVADARLDPLADNGGPTLTHALLHGSPAIDAGTCQDHQGNDVTTDQRGVSRPQGGACDIGAFELEQAPPPVTYTFIGFTAPVSNPDTLNLAKAGQTIPLKWRLLLDGQPVDDLGSVAVAVSSLDCAASSGSDAVEEYATGKSGLQNLGEGYYQYNWATQKSYAGSCKRLTLTLGEGIDLTRTALFQFTK